MSKRLTKEEFIERSKKVHGDKYDYSKVEYLSIDKKVIIIMDNVEYLQTPNQHLIGRCPENTKTKKLTTEEFISKSKEIHGDKYDYSLVNYINSLTPVKIIYDGVIYEQNPRNHLNGFKCENIKSLTQEEFISKSKEIHGDKYDYSLVDFKNVRGKIKIIYNGLIYEQLGYLHLEGKAPRGTEDKISKGEYFISCFLINNNIKYINQHWYSDCRNILPLPFDFYLPDYNILIEYDGRQHFEVVGIWGGIEELERRKFNDKIKNKYCIKNGIPLLRISHLEDVDSKLNDFLIKHYI
jgi:hypothetical protein